MEDRNLVTIQVSAECAKECIHSIKILRKIDKSIHTMALESFLEILVY